MKYLNLYIFDEETNDFSLISYCDQEPDPVEILAKFSIDRKEREKGIRTVHGVYGIESEREREFNALYFRLDDMMYKKALNAFFEEYPKLKRDVNEYLAEWARVQRKYITNALRIYSGH